MASLVMLSPAPMIELPGGEVILDVKFVEGMKLHCQLWPGTVRCVLRRGATSIDAPMRYSVAQLGFDMIALDPGAPVPTLLLDEAALVYVAADDLRFLHLPAMMEERFGKLVYTIEAPLGGRVEEAWHSTRSLRRKLGATWWNARHEGALKSALAAADGVHCNGYPAHAAYRRLNRRALRYLDNRMRAPMIARAAEMAAKAERLRAGEPLRLAWFGPLEPTSGVMDLLPMAHLLELAGVPFRLELFGTGPLAGRVQDGIAGLGLKGCVTLQPPGAFDPVLVPHLRREADIALAPSRLSAPQSYYVEALGCGLPILGYANRMWRGLQAESGAGWAVRRGAPGALARTIARLHAKRDEVAAAGQKAVEFARANSFETVFARRMNDLREIAGIE